MAEVIFKQLRLGIHLDLELGGRVGALARVRARDCIQPRAKVRVGARIRDGAKVGI